MLAVGVLAQLSGRSVAEIGTTTYRPPFTPISFALLAGRDRGRLADPERVAAIHDWHVEHGAVFEDVGQWKRPWFFPEPGEAMHEAVRRECTAARQGVAMMAPAQIVASGRGRAGRWPESGRRRGAAGRAGFGAHADPGPDARSRDVVL